MSLTVIIPPTDVSPTTGTGDAVLATSPTLTTPISASLTSPAGIDLTLAGGSSGASLVLGQGANGAATITTTGSGGTSLGSGATQPVKIGRNSDFPLFAAISFNNTFTNSGLLGITAWNGADTKLYIQHQGAGIEFRGNGIAQAIINGNGNLLIGTSDATGLTGAGGLKINSSTAGAANAGALVVTGGLSAGGASYFGGAVNFTQGLSVSSPTLSSPLELNSTLTSNYLFLNSGVGLEAMTRYYNPTAGNWYTGIRASAGLGSTSSYHIFSSVLGADVAAFNTDGAATFAGAIGAGITAGIYGESSAITISGTGKTYPLFINTNGTAASTYFYMGNGGGVIGTIGTDGTNMLFKSGPSSLTALTFSGASATFAGAVTAAVVTSTGAGYTSSGFQITNTSASRTTGLFLTDAGVTTIRDVTGAADLFTLSLLGAATFGGAVTVGGNVVVNNNGSSQSYPFSVQNGALKASAGDYVGINIQTADASPAQLSLAYFSAVSAGSRTWRLGAFDAGWSRGSIPGGLDLGADLAVTGAATFAGAGTFGGAVTAVNAASNIQITLDSIASGTAGGASLNIRNAGGNILSLGNQSNIIGGAYSAVPMVFFTGPSLRVYSNTAAADALTVSSTGAATFAGAVAIANTVAASIAAPSTHKVSILIGGVQYYLLASNI